MGDSYFYRAVLAKDKTECSNGYLDNDPLSYLFEIDGDDYNEIMQSFVIKPFNSFYAYDRVKIRKKNMKAITIEKLKKRFNDIKEKIKENKENFINLQFDLNTKI